jgi:hypothetical protein
MTEYAVLAGEEDSRHWHIHLPEHDVDVVLGPGARSLLVTALNRLTGDRFQLSLTEAAVAEVLPPDAPRSLRQIGNFLLLIRSALESQGQRRQSTAAFGAATEVRGNAREEHECFSLVVGLKTGEGVLESQHEFTVRVPLCQRASTQTRYELAIREFHKSTAVQAQALRNEIRKTHFTVTLIILLVAMFVTTIVLDQAQEDDSAFRLANHSDECPVARYHAINRGGPSGWSTVGSLNTLGQLGGDPVQLALVAFGIALLLGGWHILTAILFCLGFAGGLILGLELTWSVFEAMDMFLCAVLAVAPLVIGGCGGWVVASAAARSSPAFFMLGAAGGGVLGWVAYVLAIGHLTQQNDGAVDDRVQLLTISSPAILGGVALAWNHGRKALALATSLIGACVLTVALDQLLMIPRDARWSVTFHVHFCCV